MIDSTVIAKMRIEHYGLTQFRVDSHISELTALLWFNAFSSSTSVIIDDANYIVKEFTGRWSRYGTLDHIIVVLSQ